MLLQRKLTKKVIKGDGVLLFAGLYFSAEAAPVGKWITRMIQNAAILKLLSLDALQCVSIKLV